MIPLGRRKEIVMIPRRVRIIEVGPRDGLQNEAKLVPTSSKVEFIKDLHAAGLSEIELTSFVRADRIPQLNDSAEVFSAASKINGIDLNKCPVLVPNMRGFENAMSAGVKRVALFTATSEKFNKNNINCTIDESLQKLSAVAKECSKHNISIRGYISTVFGCPYEGKKTSGDLERIIKTLLDLGVDEISLGDTIGIATPHDVEKILDNVLQYTPVEKIAMHFHDTYSRALANVYASLKYGIAAYDTSAGGMGGCPYAKGASGNLATEDLISLLTELDIEHGVNLDLIVKASRKVLDGLSRVSSSKVHQVIANG